MVMQYFCLVLFGLSQVHCVEESAASAAQIAYAISQNYDQTGPGEHAVQQTTSSSNSEDVSGHQAYTQHFSHHLQPQQLYTNHLIQPQQHHHYQPQQYVQQQHQHQPLTVSYTHQPQQQAYSSGSQNLFGRFQTSHQHQAPVSYSHFQISPSTSHQHQQQSTQVKYVHVPQPVYQQQTSVIKAAAPVKTLAYEPTTQYLSYDVQGVKDDSQSHYSYVEQPAQQYYPQQVYSNVLHQQLSNPKVQEHHHQHAYVAKAAPAITLKAYHAQIAKPVYATTAAVAAPIAKINTHVQQQYNYSH